jgi:hypothetical protein
MPLTCIQAVLSSILGWETEYREVFHGLLQSHEANSMVISQVTTVSFLTPSNSETLSVKRKSKAIPVTGLGGL